MKFSSKSGRVAVGAALVLALAVPLARGQSPRFSLGIFGKYTADGMVVQTVVPDSAMARAGVQRGDVILKIDGRLITNQDDLAAVLETSGGYLTLVVHKANGRTVRLTADVAGRGKLPAPYALGILGQFTPAGMRVNVVVPGTAAERVGLQKGDLILRMNGEFIRNQDDFNTVLNASGGSVALLVRKAAGGRTVRVDADLNTCQLGALGEFTAAGARMTAVTPGSPADRAGLQRGDLIVRIDNQPVRSQKEFDAAIANSGGSALFVVRKGLTGQLVRLPVDLMNNPLGAWCEPVEGGLRVVGVGPGTAADLLGLERGDVILKVDDRRVRSKSDLMTALNSSGGFVTLVVRKGLTGRLARIEADLAR